MECVTIFGGGIGLSTRIVFTHAGLALILHSHTQHSTSNESERVNQDAKRSNESRGQLFFWLLSYSNISRMLLIHLSIVFCESMSPVALEI